MVQGAAHALPSTRAAPAFPTKLHQPTLSDNLSSQGEARATLHNKDLPFLPPALFFSQENRKCRFWSRGLAVAWQPLSTGYSPCTTQ